MINVVLMAGRGERFTKEGYTTPKPLLSVAGKPMIFRAIEGMPKADRWIFVIREDYLENKELLKTLKSIRNDVEIMVNYNSVSQLSSALVPKKYYSESEPLFIGACDFGMVYDQSKFFDLINNGKADLISFSFTGQPNLSRNPTAWGWLKQDENMLINGVSVKIPISYRPGNDYAITGSFAFKNGKYFLNLADEILRRDIQVKGEHYIDSMIGLACELGHKVISFPVKYIGWGTPTDYEENKNKIS